MEVWGRLEYGEAEWNGVVGFLSVEGGERTEEDTEGGDGGGSQE